MVWGSINGEFVFKRVDISWKGRAILVENVNANIFLRNL